MPNRVFRLDQNLEQHLVNTYNYADGQAAITADLLARNYIFNRDE